jgi:hypothetical protein
MVCQEQNQKNSAAQKNSVQRGIAYSCSRKNTQIFGFAA